MCLICSRTCALPVMQHARVVHRHIDGARRRDVRSNVRAHPLDGSLDPYALEVIGAHTDEAFPRPRLAKDLIVRECGEVRSETRDRRVGSV